MARGGRVWLVGFAGLLTLAGCGRTTSATTATTATSHPTASPGVIRVPGDAATLAVAAQRAVAGSLILLSPGVYHQSVTIKVPHVTLRGMDRNTVVIDGDVLRPNDIVLTGAGDAVQNLTVRGAILNGVLVTGQTDAQGDGIGKHSDGYSPNAAVQRPLDGFVVDHVTSYNNGLYGVYAFDVVNGTIEDTYTSGMPDSGIYVGECKPCRVSVTGNVAERNAVGYEGTNASGGMAVWGNRFVGNRVGATLDSDHQEALVPQNGSTFEANLVADNEAVATPLQADGGFGIGLGIAGGTHNLVTRNLITANAAAGLEITNTDDLAPIGNQVTGNRFAANGVDIVYSAAAAAAGSGNCLAGNEATSIRPPDFPRACPAGATPRGAAMPTTHAPAGIAFTDVAPPPPQPGLANPATAPTAPVVPAEVPAGLAMPTADLLAARSSTRW